MDPKTIEKFLAVSERYFSQPLTSAVHSVRTRRHDEHDRKPDRPRAGKSRAAQYRKQLEDLVNRLTLAD